MQYILSSFYSEVPGLAQATLPSPAQGDHSRASESPLTTDGQPPWDAHLEPILLEFLQDPPEPQEAGLSHAKHWEATPHLPEVGSPTALQGAQYVHLLSDVTHQEIATLTERTTADQSGTRGFLLRQDYVGSTFKALGISR